MSNQYLGEIRMFGGNFAIRGWALCDGQILPLQQNTALFSLLGTTYGGDGRSTFALPDLQGAAPMHQGNGAGLSSRVIGEASGVPSVTLLNAEMPAHTHVPQASSSAATQPNPGNGVWAASTVGRTPPPMYQSAKNTTLNPLALTPTGGGSPHNNMQPYLVVNFIIALEGNFPPRG